jgi:hypothetical protein
MIKVFFFALFLVLLLTWRDAFSAELVVTWRSVDKGARSNVWAHAAVDGAALEYKTFMALV